MVDKNTGRTVSLSWGNWISLIALILVCWGAAWKFSVDISVRLQAVELKVEWVKESVAGLHRGEP